MPERLPVLTILSPLPNSVVGNAPFNVMGSVSTGSITEPVNIDAVIVEIIGQPGVVHATLAYIPPSGNQPAQVTFKTTMQITGGHDPHGVVISVKSDAPLPVTRAVTVTVGPRLVPPSAWVDVLLPMDKDIDPTKIASRLSGVLATIAQKLASLQIVKDMIGYWIIVGPNVVVANTSQPVLRFGFWIVPQDFAPPDLILPTTDFPFPQMTPAAAAGCFGLVPVLPFQLLNPTLPANLPFLWFALSIPTITIQLIVDMLLSTINAETERHGLTLNYVTVQTGSGNTLVGQVSTSFLGIAVNGTVTETLGPLHRAGTESNMAAVVNSSVSSGLLDVLTALIPFLGGVGAAIAEALVLGKVAIINSVLNKLPAWIPISNSSLSTDSNSGSGPTALQNEFPFPMFVLNFSEFGTNESGVIGAGMASLADRDQSMVGVNLSGPKSLPKYSPGSQSSYDVSLTAFEPDNDQMTWQVSGGGSTGTVDIGSFSQEGSFSTAFPISSGSKTFTLSVTGTETCATDPAKTLTGSYSIAVDVAVPEAHKDEAAPAANANAESDMAAAAAQPKIPLAS
jgi:hypothetical protein